MASVTPRDAEEDSEEDGSGGSDSDRSIYDQLVNHDIHPLVLEAEDAKTFKFEQEAYTNAFVCVAGYSGGYLSIGRLDVILAILFMIFVWGLQFVVTYAVSRKAIMVIYVKFQYLFHVTKEAMHYTDLSTRITQDDASAVCGDFRSISTPDTFIYQTIPVEREWQRIGSWDASDLSYLQGSIHSLYLLNWARINFYTYIIAVLAWSVSLLAELKNVITFSLCIYQLKTSPRCVFGSGNDGDPKEIEIESITRGLKWLATLITSLRLFLALFLYVAGCLFLFESLSVMDLLMNAVALIFVLELDTLLYAGMNLLSVLDSVTIVNEAVFAKYPKGVHVRKVCGLSFCLLLKFADASMLALLVLANFFFCKQLLKKIFAASAAICLYMGPPPMPNTFTSTNDKHQYQETFQFAFPVGGLCETLVCEPTLYSTTNITCIPKVDKDVHDESIYVRILQDECKVMMQKNYSSYSVLAPVTGATLRNPELGSRVTDADLVDLGLNDPAGNFWCPSESVKAKLSWGAPCDVVKSLNFYQFVTLPPSPIDDLSDGFSGCMQGMPFNLPRIFDKFWEANATCKSSLSARSTKLTPPASAAMQSQTAPKQIAGQTPYMGKAQPANAALQQPAPGRFRRSRR